jgi:hypothetical protein
VSPTDPIAGGRRPRLDSRIDFPEWCAGCCGGQSAEWAWLISRPRYRVFCGVLGGAVAGGWSGVAAWGGPQVWVTGSVHASFQGQLAGGCSFSRLVEEAIRTVIGLRRMVAAVALSKEGLLAAARVRLNAMTARTSQAAFVVRFLDGRWSREPGWYFVGSWQLRYKGGEGLDRPARRSAHADLHRRGQRAARARSPRGLPECCRERSMPRGTREYLRPLTR